MRSARGSFAQAERRGGGLALGECLRGAFLGATLFAALLTSAALAGDAPGTGGVESDGESGGPQELPVERTLDAASGGVIEGGVATLGFLPDGRRLCAGALDGAVRVVDLAEPRDRWVEVHRHVGAVAGVVGLTLEGRAFVLSAGDDGVLALADVDLNTAPSKPATRRAAPAAVTFTAGIGPLTALAVLPATEESADKEAKEVTVVVGGARGVLAVVRVGAGGLTLERTLEGAHEGPITALAPLEKRRVASAGYDGRVRVTDLASGREVKAARVAPVELSSLAASADGKTLAVGSWRKGIQLLDAASLKARGAALEPHKGGAGGLVFAGAGAATRLCSFSIADELVAVSTLGAPGAKAGGRTVLRAKPRGTAGALCASADGRRLACGTFEGSVVIYTLAPPAAPFDSGPLRFAAGPSAQGDRRNAGSTGVHGGRP